APRRREAGASRDGGRRARAGTAGGGREPGRREAGSSRDGGRRASAASCWRKRRDLRTAT
ncbi:MAG: ATP-dependent RNA helicase, partial [Solirubrobacteraceae bacterium]